jgi:hypothetical protein
VSAVESPDPVAESQAYQLFLLAALGQDDPAEAQAAVPARIRALIVEAGDLLRVRPEPKEWSVLECIAHIVDAEIVMSGRYRFAVAHEDPPLIGYDQDLWVDNLRRNEDDVETLLACFEGLRRANVAMWRASTDEERARVGLHSERGPESYDLAYRMIAGHDRVHLGQADRTLTALRV